jgi:hypothetical protein
MRQRAEEHQRPQQATRNKKYRERKPEGNCFGFPADIERAVNRSLSPQSLRAYPLGIIFESLLFVR